MQKPYKPRFPDVTDIYSKTGAFQVARYLERYWKGRGYHGMRAEAFLIEGTRSAWGIRSNIGPLGYPPKVAA